jgi:nucleoid DNA-binding protein
LVPKKATELFKPVAEQTGANENLVQDLVSFYWTELRKTIVDLKAPNINISQLGTFKVKPWRVTKVITKYTEMIEVYKQKTPETEMSFQRFTILKDLENRLVKLRALEVLVEEEKSKRQQVRSKRYAKPK